MPRSRLALVLVTGIVIGLSSSIGFNVFAARHATAAGAGSLLPWEDARLLAEVLHRIQTDYVETVGEHELIENAVRGMVGSLDAHSTFLDAEEYEEMQASTAGSYPGIGIEVEAADRGVRVMRAVPGAPAARGGMVAGDLIVGIDGQAVKDDVEDAITRLRGRAGTVVRVGVEREGSPQPLEFSLRRTQVEVHSVASQWLEPGYGYLRISQFSETTHKDVEAAVRRLRRDAPNGTLTGLVIDLRNNPGGLLDAAVEVADEFLDSGNIVSADGRTEDARFRMDALKGELLPGVPLVVLVNGGSASAAEILAGALHDNERATLVGTKTYGKGSVQTIMPLSDGRAIKLTTSHYYTPSGASIDAVGIQPDLRYAGEDLSPADLDDAEAVPTLAARDGEIRFALSTLKLAPRVAGSPQKPVLK
ncbi:MAG: S41 family peptidase [Steroidobacteraceae bacterium]